MTRNKGTRRLLNRFKDLEYEVQEGCFGKIPTRLSRPAEPSQQLCRLQSAGLPSLVATLFSRTTVHPIVVQPYTL